jgi:hypothetical protein
MSAHGICLKSNDTCLETDPTGQGSEGKTSDPEVLEDATRPKLVAHQIPVELLQQIYQLLGPKDFNSARHTCRSWMRGSLDEKLLLSMLSRSGWTSWDHEARSKDGVWELSKSLSREYALSSDWTGNGVDKKPLCTEMSSISFSELDQKPDFCSRLDGLVFVTSICGDYVLVARDRRIFVYRLRSRSLAPVTSIICPRRVLSMNMDGSSGRPTVAALLEGRMGIVCELQYGEAVIKSPAVVELKSTERITFESSSTDIDNQSDNNIQSARDEVEPIYEIHLRSGNSRACIRGLWDSEMNETNLICQTWPLKLRGILEDSSNETCTRRLRVEKGKCIIYRRLCLKEDAPLSVSICPDHPCVAFGCSRGMELHWIDVVTGQNLSRWFPLMPPSDHVHFVQPRLGFESARKLRLTSSPAHISSPGYIRDRIVSAHGFCGDARSPDHDYYHAVPLSDGHHILFLDSMTKVLTLGCDETTGESVRLIRKIQLVPPYKSAIASVYTSAFDMTWGARIVAAYGDTITLYNIPPDVLDFSCFEHDTEVSCRSIILGRQARREWLDWRNNESASAPSINLDANSDRDGIWPLAIGGTEVGKLEGVCALAVQSVPGVSVWAFSRSGQCKSWRAGGCVDASVRDEEFVCRSGFVHDVHEKHDEDRGQSSQQPAMVDVGRSRSGELEMMPKVLAVENDEAVEDVDVRGCLDAWYNEDGDVGMFREFEEEDGSGSEGGGDGVVWSEVGQWEWDTEWE